MKRFLLLIILVCIVGIAGCSNNSPQAQIAATTLPVYEFTAYLCQDTPLSVTRLVTESVSCLHDYTLQTRQLRAAESAQLLVISGAGLDDFLDEIDTKAIKIADCSQNIDLICSDNTPNHDDEHHHEEDPHIWLSPANAKTMVLNIYNALLKQYPEHKNSLQTNYHSLCSKLDDLEQYGKKQLENLSAQYLITFHDGFSYLAQAFNLTILHAIEEESGSEASAGELIEIIKLIDDHEIDCIFTEVNGSVSAADIISNECDIKVFQLDMCMGERSYFEAMYYNIDTLKEALE